MARTTVKIPLKKYTADQAISIIGNIVERKGYVAKVFGGEEIWAKGDGILGPMKCFGVTFSQDGIIVQAWMKNLTMEQALEGIVALPHQIGMKKILEQIKAELQ